MGWCHDDGTHEGYLVALVFDDSGRFEGHGGYPDRKTGLTSGRMRELGRPDDDEGVIVQARKLGNDRKRGRARKLGQTIPIRFVKAACSCGWRSPLLRAPSGAQWSGYVHVSEWFEDAARELWHKHADETGTVHDGGLTLRPLPMLTNEEISRAVREGIDSGRIPWPPEKAP